MGDYNQVWAPEGVVADDVPNPHYLQVVERPVLDTDAACSVQTQLALADGTMVCGSIGLANFGSGAGPVDWGGHLTFQRGRVYYRVVSVGLTPSQVLDALNSIR